MSQHKQPPACLPSLEETPLQTSAIRTADGRIVSDADDVRSRWAKYFERLYVAEPPSRRLSMTGVEVAAADPSVDETLPSLAEVREAVNKLRGSEASRCLQYQRRDAESLG